jgi:hypothetical protein
MDEIEYPLGIYLTNFCTANGGIFFFRGFFGLRGLKTGHPGTAFSPRKC